MLSSFWRSRFPYNSCTRPAGFSLLEIRFGFGRREGCAAQGIARMTWVKICGTTNLEDALIAVDAGADAVGFVFYQNSPRNVSVEAAREIIQNLPAGVEKVGVFVDLEAERVHEIVLKAGLTTVQLHGARSLESVFGNSSPVVDSVGVEKLIAMIPESELQRESGVGISKRLREKAFAVLVDSQVNGESGGTGTKFDWEATRGMVQMLGFVLPVIVAGGLTPSDVAEAMTTFQPFGVDVASGVEASPGKKDPEKVRAFVRAVREIDRKTS
jgi:phosphoribosylanthranilate isomerase